LRLAFRVQDDGECRRVVALAAQVRERFLYKLWHCREYTRNVKRCNGVAKLAILVA
jgi:hypothetical protein